MLRYIVNWICLLAVTLQLGGCTASKKLDMPGDRISLLELDRADIVTENEEIGRITPPPVHLNHSWNGGLNHLSATMSNLAWNYEGQKPYTLSFSKSSKLANPSIPAVYDDKLFVLSASGKVIAYDLHTKKILWSNQYFETVERVNPIEIFSTHFLSGAIYIAANKVFVTAGLNKVAALDVVSGELIWKAELSHPVRSVPKLVGNHLVLQTVNDHVYGLNMETGTTAWMQVVGFGTVSSLVTPSPLILEKNHVILHTADDALVALNGESGQEMWSHDLISNGRKKLFFGGHGKSAISPVDSLFAIGDTVIANDASGMMFAINHHTGDTVWEKNLIGSENGASWTVGNAVLTTQNHQQMVALNIQTGAKLWSCDLRRSDSKGREIRDVFYTNPITANNKAYIANNLGELMEISLEDGKLMQSIKIPAMEYVHMVIAEGMMILTTNNGNVVII